MTDRPEPFADPEHEGNSAVHHTGKKCYGVPERPDCTNPAGTSWSPLWCFECNVIRIQRIGDNLNAMLRNFEDHGSVYSE